MSADRDAGQARCRTDPPDVLVNPGALARVPGAARTREPLTVHRRLPGYAPTPLVSRPALAGQLGLRQLLIKDESGRLGLPAFKVLGASYACYRALTGRLQREPDWESVSELAAAIAALRPLTLCAATDGNHGRAVAWMARLLGLAAVIYVPAGMARARIEAIAAEGATVREVQGGYDDAVRRSAQDASETCMVVSDTSWPGYEQIPRWVIEGYSTVFAEVSDQLADRGEDEPDVVVLPVGVGALAAAAVSHYKSGAAGQCSADGATPPPGRPGNATRDIPGSSTMLLGIEPLSARCVTESLRAGHPVTLPFPQTSIMSGLNCGTPSMVGWPLVATGMDAMAVVSDGWAASAVVALASAGIVAGETGAAALAGLQAVMTCPAGEGARTALRLGPASSVLVLCTEGATDPAAWQQITGSGPDG